MRVFQRLLQLGAKLIPTHAGLSKRQTGDLLIDNREHKVRFLQVAAGGFLELGERKFLIPVDAIICIEDDKVRVDQTREHVMDAP